ncbi:hypothetical protein NDI85_06105 [Halomicroarcula sp. S1AR25-4]|uniref:hypothetical protein n=1 Tax=Haloarcula sp. S1AR25-4 TaxID=2950538 RepID=UPI002875DF0A|nr:hypothetical protein [Halomicroarcula sp. S1AR25-4]MDS0277359.1 hypothetical protein [Halomicroarcula sp. S1AR25-4]
MQVLHDATSPQAKLILLYLEERGPTPPSEIASDLALHNLTVLSVLDTLGNRELVVRQDGRIQLTNDD